MFKSDFSSRKRVDFTLHYQSHTVSYFSTRLTIILSLFCLGYHVNEVRAKDLKPIESAREIATLIKTVYELDSPRDTPEQLKKIIREDLDRQWRAGFLPIDAYGISAKSKPRPLLKVSSTMWKELPKQIASSADRRKEKHLVDGILGPAQLDAFLERLFTPSRTRSQRFQMLNRSVFPTQEGPVRNATGLLETSFALAMENMARLPKRLKRWREKHKSGLIETVTLLERSLSYLEKIHSRGELISSEQYMLIELSLATCHLALNQIKEARHHIKIFFKVPSPGESILQLGGLLESVIKANQGGQAQSVPPTEITEGEAENEEFEDTEAQKETDVINSPKVEYTPLRLKIREWSNLLKGERLRLRRLKGETRDILLKSEKIKNWWHKALEGIRESLNRTESTLAVEQLLVTLIQTAKQSQMVALKDHPIEWIKIPAGKLWIPPNDQADHNEREVIFEKGFMIAKTEVTVAQYQACMDEGVCEAPHWSRCADQSKSASAGFTMPKRPIVCIDWRQARVFSKWVGGDLPSETQWLYAAQGGESALIYPWGGQEPSCERAIFNEDGDEGCGERRTWDVCSRPLGLSPHEICDLAGNVWEWVLDQGSTDGRQLVLPVYHERGEPSCLTANCERATGLRISRGGGWESAKELLQNKNRAAFGIDERHPNLGFRPVKPIE